MFKDQGIVLVWRHPWHQFTTPKRPAEPLLGITAFPPSKTKKLILKDIIIDDEEIIKTVKVLHWLADGR